MPVYNSNKKNIKIEINEEWCKGCVICVDFCPKDVLKMEGGKAKVADIEACTVCGLCELLCPDFAITVAGSRKTDKKDNDQ